MLPINIALVYEQENRELQALDAINELADRNTDLESSGHWDGWLNEAPNKKHWGEERISKRIRNRNHPTLRPEISYFYRRILESISKQKFICLLISF